MIFKKDISRKQWLETAERIANNEELSACDWKVLRSLVNKQFLFGLKKDVRDELLIRLYSIDEAGLNEEIIVTRNHIKQKYIVMIYRGSNNEIDKVDLMKRRLRMQPKQSLNA